MVAKKSLPLSWYEEEAALPFLEAERAELMTMLPTLYGYHLVFVGEAALATMVQSSLISHQILINHHKQGKISQLSYLQSAADAIPLQNESVDVVILSHALEHAKHPHEVLREAHRVLIPEGHLIITGINPTSLWGLWYSWKQMKGRIPSQGRMISQSKLKDWLSLLNFQIIKSERYFYRPPLKFSPLLNQLEFMERWGRRILPFCAGAYTLLAVKRVIPLTPIRARWRLDKRIWHPAAVPGIPKPTTKSQ